MTYTNYDLQKDIGRLYEHVPHVEPILFLVPVVLGDVPTAHCSAREIVLGAAFMASLPPEKRLGLILHECVHALLCHMSDPWTDTTLPLQTFRVRANIAMDYVVERLVVEAQKSSGGIVASARTTSYLEKVKKYRQFSWIEIYHLLPKSSSRSTSFDEHEFSNLTLEEVQQLQKQAQQAHQEMEHIAKGRGRTSAPAQGSLSCEGGQAEAINWRNQLRDFLQTFTAVGGQHWRSVDLRSLCYGRLNPKRTEEDKRFRNVRLLLDTSGSMHGAVADAVQDLAQILTRVGCETAVLRYYGSGLLPDKITVVEDGQVIVDMASARSVPGGGGTAIRNALEELGQDSVERAFEGLTVALTDGQDDLNVAGAEVRPDVWIIYGNAGVRPDCGYVVYI